MAEMKEKVNIRIFMRALKICLQQKSFISMIISVLGLGAAFLSVLISKQLEKFTDLLQGMSHDTALLKKTLFAFGILAVFYILQTVFEMLQNHYTNEDTIRIQKYIRKQLIKKTLEIPYPYIENYNGFRDNLDFVKQYASQRMAGSISLVFGWISNAITFISIIVVLSEINVWLVIVLLVSCIPAIILSNIQKDEDFRYRTKWMKEGRLTIHYADVCRSNEAMKDIRFFGIFDWLKEKWRHYASIYIQQKTSIIKKHVIYNSIADILRNGVYLIVLFITAYEIYHDSSRGLGTFMLVISLAGQFQTVTTSVLVKAVTIFTDSKYLKCFFDVIDMETEEEVSVTTARHSMTDDVIEFENVSFSYPGNQYKALDHITVKIHKGEKIAIVGANGSGKSTFVSLLCGLFQCDDGEIRFHGNNIKNQLSLLRDSLSVVFQDFCHYEDSLRNNVLALNSKLSIRDEEILQMASKTGMKEIIDQMEHGLDEVIGSFNTNGINLSGGQWQKVAITRALCRKEAEIFILDEPTAALDPLSEAKLYRNFNDIVGEKTTLLISHRLGITSMVDRILVFDQGHIIEDGSHEELMKLNGCYAKMYEAQAKWYQNDVSFN